MPRCLPVRSAGPGDVEHVVEQLERQPDARAELAQQRDVAAAGQRAQLAGGPEQPRGLQIAAPQVALARASAAFQASSRCSSSPWTSADDASESTRTGSAAPPPASSANARENSRSPVAVAIARPAAATTVGRPRRSDGGVEHVVVDERRRVHELDRDRGAQRARRARPASGPAATNTSSGRSRLPPAAIVAPACSPSVGPCDCGDRGQALLEARHQRRGRARPPASTTAATASALAISSRPSRECSAMIPPAVRIQRDVAAARRAPARRASALGPGEALDRVRQVRVGLVEAARSAARRDRTTARRTSTAAASAAS